MENLLSDLYTNIQYLKFAEKYLRDIDIVYSFIENFSREESSMCASTYLQKYYGTSSTMGKMVGGIRLVYNRTIYTNKSDEDIIDDLYFIIWSIMCEAYVDIGLSKSIKDFVLQYLY